MKKIGRRNRAITPLIPTAWHFIKVRFRLGKWSGISLTVGVACFALGILSFAAIVASISAQGKLPRLDLQINAYMSRAATPGLIRFFGTVTELGSIYLVLLVAVLVAVILFIKKSWWRLLALFLAVGVGQAVLNILKDAFQRSRPKTELFVFGSSFPSGHTFSATVIYGFCIYLTWRFIKKTTIKWIVSAGLALLILLIGFSRLYLGVHWFSDALAGHVTGLAWLLFCIFFARTVADR